MTAERVFIPLDLGYTHVQNSRDAEYKKNVETAFGHYSITFNVGRMSEKCYIITIEHKDVQTARYDTMSYTETFTLLLGDEATTKFGRKIKLVSGGWPLIYLEVPIR